MAFQVSPGVLVQERDLTRIIPAVSTSVGAFAGEFRKGPLDEIITLSSEQELVETFGKPDSNNFEDFFSAANFLQYSNALRVVRAQNSSVANAVASGSAFVIKNETDYINNFATGQGSVGEWAARTAGAWGNNLLVSICPSAAAYETTVVTTLGVAAVAGATSVTVTSGTNIAVGDIINFSTTASTSDYNDGHEYRVTAKSTNVITIVRHPSGTGGLQRDVVINSNIRRRWRFYDQVAGAPGTSPYATSKGGSNDEIHVIVVDEDGGISGTANTVLEVYQKLSKASDAKTPQGDTNYYPTVIQTRSKYVYWMDHNSGGSNWGNTASGTTFTAVTTPTLTSLQSGSDGSAVTIAQKKTAYEKFLDSETVDVGLIIAGSGDATHVDNVISIAEDRKDAVDITLST
jgi:hypothetical protein